jgi:tetratricopeptide (TPR) repeat protein
LVSRRDGQWYRCHPLVQSYAKRRLAEDPELQAAACDARASLVLEAVRNAPNVDTFDSGTVLDGVEDPLANVLAVFADLVERGRFESVAELADPLDRLLGFHGRLLTLQDALQMAVRALVDQASGSQAGADEVRDRLEMHLVWLYLRLGQYQEAAATADRLLAGANTAPDLVIELTRARSAIDRTEGQVDQALQRLLAVRDLAATVSERLKAMIDDDIGLCQMVLGLYPESRESYRAVLAWARRTGSQPVIARTLLSLGIGHHDGGEILDSLAYLVEAKSVVTVNGLRHIEPYVDVKLARTYLYDGDFDAAAEVIDGARARSGASWEPWLTAEFDLVSARLAAARDDPETMWAMLERSLTTSADLDDLPFVAKSLVALVDLGSARPEIGPKADGGVQLLASVADTGSGADYADRLEAERLLERLGDSVQPESPKPLVDVIDDGFGYLRRGRLLVSRGLR